ncbi:peptidoglycan D,D-transpeptidase FtsI family protein [Imhoffiella purpurea]|uniref:Cell division protein FtsI n=1 Tax=Imhoffiella purpurea TaxID=1249627 RepID=W9V829_9GAMM|nr:penicillin-binding transpeptidase domain-containing protein [Imhoffiella purpurea]EXJ15584.1 Cell division protein FtsI [Imhoffiella purpurea]
MSPPLDPAIWPSLRLALHIAFFMAIFFLLKQILELREMAQLRHLARPKGAFRIPLVMIAIAFGALLIYQASWQLTGMLRPQFIAFMQLHDRREFNPAHWIRRGRILDRNGEVLAYSEEIQGKVYRLYPDGPVFSPVVGYSQPRFGSTGMEAVANVHLNGGAPADLSGWGELGRQIVGGGQGPRGQDLRLTLDADLQRMAVARIGERRGAILLMDPNDGDILVLASVPSYDPNRISSDLFMSQDPSAPLLNRVTQGLYPPGSTFKIAVAAMALERGFDERIDCPADGYTTSSRYPKIRDHEYYSALEHGSRWKGHGRIDMRRALSRSSNVFFAKLGVIEGHDAFRALGERMLMNRQITLHRTPYGTYAMRTGRMPRLSDRDLYGLAQLAIGQGKLLVTPAYMGLLTAAVARQGIAVRPRLLDRDPPQGVARFMSADTANRLADMMRTVVAEGTARGIDTPDLSIAGKTGTAQNPQGASHSWFVGFAPTQRPTLAIAVLVEEGGYGSAVAAPIARDLLLAAHAKGD